MPTQKDETLDLIEPKNDQLTTGRIFDMLTEIRAENVWLANFSSDNTRDAYKRAVGSFIATIGLETPDELYSVSQAHVIAWRSSMEKAGLSQASIANRLSALSSLFRHLTDNQLATQNPVSGVKRPKTGNGGIGGGKTPSLSAQQVRDMLDAPDVSKLQGLRDRALLHVFFYVGTRCSEPTKLKVKDFRFDQEFRILELTVKGNKKNTVAINPVCAQAISEYLDAAGHGDQPDSFLFQPVQNGRADKPISRTQVYRLFEKYAVLAGLPAGVYPHVSRATMITHAYANKVAGEDIQRTVGHASITTTEGYNQTAVKHRESASLKMGY